MKTCIVLFSVAGLAFAPAVSSARTTITVTPGTSIILRVGQTQLLTATTISRAIVVDLPQKCSRFVLEGSEWKRRDRQTQSVLLHASKPGGCVIAIHDAQYGQVDVRVLVNPR